MDQEIHAETGHTLQERLHMQHLAALAAFLQTTGDTYENRDLSLVCDCVDCFYRHRNEIVQAAA